VKPESRFEGTQTYVSARWPVYLLGYGGGSVLALLLLGLSAQEGWWGAVLILLALLLLLLYFFGAAVWAAYQLYDVRGQRPADFFFELGRLGPTARFAHVGLGRRRTPVQLSRRLTGGQVTVIDVYNPQQAPDPALARARFPAGSAELPPDPRIQWREGQIDLLPLPDGSVPVVTVDRTLGQLWEHGDRLLLLREIRRILVPGGQLLLAEEARTRTALLTWGLPALRRPPLPYWEQLLSEAGFRLRQETDSRDLLQYLVAEKPYAGEMQQLTFDFGLPTHR
jgi:ubiquinone/menaquinone biosynthesis C-methylase UbiE